MSKNSYLGASHGGNTNHEDMVSRARRYEMKTGLIKQPLPCE